MTKMIFITAAATVALIATTALTKAEPVRLKMVSSFPSSQPLLGEAGVKFAETVSKISGGDVEVRFYEPGALVPALEVLDAVSAGAAEAAWTQSGYWAGKDVAFALFSAIPFGPDASAYSAWMFYGGGQDFVNKNLYAPLGVHSLVCGVSPPETSGWFREEIKSIEDMVGLRMRFYGLGAQVMQKLGVDTQLLPGGEIYPALERGTIDATEYSMPAVDEAAGFYQLAKYNYFPGWHQQSTLQALLINLETWNGMTDSQRLTLETACMATYTSMLAEGEAINGQALTRLRDEHGVNIRNWTPEQLAVFQSSWLEVAEELRAQSPIFDQAWGEYQTFKESYDVWKSNAYLPADIGE
ncbi:TRAP transporter substrate-binding protein [Ahrensia sp. 13_GOM-1096m]|uniref:TRAP transporter substrate-binding protein n=1 Tax=Ahrensia sp. 13_GOM-1096m TaxID=1380380 RepID=UPI00047C3C46|nr:TRAP transporter substrate-binding protein [Ahrensia sp. 13_GOM-1096m]